MTSFFDKSTNEGQTVTEDMQAVSIQSKEHTQNAMAKCRNGFICFLSFLLYGGGKLSPLLYTTPLQPFCNGLFLFLERLWYMPKSTRVFWPLCPGNGASVGINAAKENGATEAVPLSENERFLSLFNYPAL